MAKRQDTQESRGPTRKQVARSRKEQQQLRMIYLGLGLVAFLVVLVLAVGLIQTYVIEPNAPVAIVNGTEITMQGYQDRVQYERFLLDQQYQQILQQQAALAQPGNEQLAELLGPQYDQYAAQVLQQRQSVGAQTVDVMIEDALVIQEAGRRDLAVSPEEVNERINRIVAAQLGGLTTEAASATETAWVQASATAALWTPTPTFTPSPTITATTEISPSAAITGTEAVTEAVTTPAETPTPAPTPTLNVIPESDLATQSEQWLAVLEEQAGVDEETYRDIVRTLVLREELQEAIGEETPREAEQALVRHILVETEEEAQEVIDRLEAGEDFAELAEELSLDTVSGAAGGDLGWTSRGRFVEPVDEAVFSLPVGEISEPVQSDFGWHIIEVLEREERELSPADYRRAQLAAYDEWLNQARAEADIENLWTFEMVPPETSPVGL